MTVLTIYCIYSTLSEVTLRPTIRPSSVRSDKAYSMGWYGCQKLSLMSLTLKFSQKMCILFRQVTTLLLS